MIKIALCDVILDYPWSRCSVLVKKVLAAREAGIDSP